MTRYRFGEEIGRGALGRVLIIHDSVDDQVYAGKILHGSHQGDSKAHARFLSEAAALAKIQDENIVRVYGIETIDFETTMRMELVEGPSLGALIALESPLSSERIVTIAAQIASGLRAAHRAGLVHRDLKPHNILLTHDEVAKIADFGMARAASFAGVDSSAFAVAGTPDYMAPECIDPLAVDARSDLYSFGCILYEMATGAPPFGAATSFAVLEAHRSAPVPNLPSAISPALAQLIYELLAKSPADRPQSAATVERRLRQLADAPSTSLAAVGTSALALNGTCTECGQPLVPAVATCFGCGQSIVSLEKGDYSVFVIGPGEVGDKLDSALRQRLLHWLESNPSLGLDASPLAKRVPRVPFVLVTRTSQGSAESLVRAIEKLGLQCTLIHGRSYRLPAMRKKSWLLTKRILAIGVGSGFYWQSSLGALVAPILGAGLVGSFAGGWVLAAKSSTKKKSVKRQLLPAPVASSLASVSVITANMQLRRHRENLRAIVERALWLSEHLPADALASSEADLARLLDMALIACSRMDEIEVSIADADMRNPTPETLELMRERDRWAGRVLEVTAFLDSLRVRTASVRHAGSHASQSAERMDELRGHIAALEEVQAL